MRPPGALDEAAFLSACTRCGRCLEACPPEAIGKDAAGFPTLQPGNVPCALCAAVPCASACPSDIGALRPVAAEAIRIGFARVFDKLCLNHHEAESCENCLDWCPVPGALVAGPRGIPTVVLEHCTGCGACARHCKAYPSAIGIHPR
ncbi:MAG: 4Fe-4S binding protein [Myxococcota bacterium]